MGSPIPTPSVFSLIGQNPVAVKKGGPYRAASLGNGPARRASETEVSGEIGGRKS
jgi:hypothetical protein